LKDREVKSISFKLTDPWENELLNHAKKYSNFSNYVKRLIQRDKEAQAYAKPQVKQGEIKFNIGNNQGSI
jgi:hypothetical protein